MASSGPDLKLVSSPPRKADAVGVLLTDMATLSPERRRLAEAGGFEAKAGETLVVPGEAAALEVIVGVGSNGSGSAGVAEYRLAGAAFARAVRREHHAALVAGPEAGPEMVAALAEGVGLAGYRFLAHKGAGTAATPMTDRISLVAGGRGVRAAFDQAVAIVNAVALARDLINEPGGSLVPEQFVERARSAVDGRSELKLSVWDEKKIAREKLGGLLAVNRGSIHPPRLLMISYTPSTKARAAKKVALVGKGITFDSGGLSLKTGTGMMTMKIDMAGGAAVLAAMCMLETLGCPNSVTAYIPLTDNMPSGDAIRPGDVFTARNGKTVEVLNTDAEGRLVLADALSLAVESEPDAIVDIATLTGSVTGALGVRYAGLMGNDEDLLEQAQQAAAAAGENVWPLPLPDDYRKDLESEVADLRNIGKGPYGGALVAGLFLREFVGDLPWVHFDLGLAAMSEVDEGLLVKGGTGTGARTLARLAASLG